MVKTKETLVSRSGNRRGYYIYGKDFFIVPNKLWKKVSENDRVILNLVGSRTNLSLEKKYLIPTLREPSDCAYEIQPRLSYYALSIPDQPLKSLPANVQTYIEHSRKLLGSKEIPAVGLYKGTSKRWYSHVWYGLREPFGSIIIPEKFRPYQRGVAAHYVDTAQSRIAVPVTFYTRSAGSPCKDIGMVAWLNSTVGLAFRYKDRAWLGKASERMSGEQLDAMEVLNVSECSITDLGRLGKCLFDMPSPLPDFEKQLEEPYYSESGRSELDNLTLELMGVKESKINHYKRHCTEIVKEWINIIKLINA